MSGLIIVGAIVTLIGLAGLGYCIAKAFKLRTAALEDAEMTQQLQRLVPINLSSVCIAAIGLMMVVIGILF